MPEAATVETTATPIEPPTSWQVLTTPEARPASWCSIMPSAVVVAVTKTVPRPKEATTKPGSRPAYTLPSAVSRVSGRDAAAAIAMPATMIAACGVVRDSAILMVDAMAVGPEFGALASATPRTGSFVVAVPARAAGITLPPGREVGSPGRRLLLLTRQWLRKQRRNRSRTHRGHPVRGPYRSRTRRARSVPFSAFRSWPSLRAASA
jgi:hypothetical protein